MSLATLETVQHLIDQLTFLDQVRLLEYLVLRIVRGVAMRQTGVVANETRLADARQEFFRIDDALAASDEPGKPTLTQTMQRMRQELILHQKSD